MFSTDQFCRFRQNHRATIFNQQIAGFAEGRIGRDPRAGIRSAALGTEDQFRSVDLHLHLTRRLAKHLAGGYRAGRRSLDRTAFILYNHQLDRLARASRANLFRHRLRPQRLAAQTDHDDPEHVGVGSMRHQHPFRKFQVSPQLGTAILMLHPYRAADHVGNAARNPVGADHRRQYQHMVTDSRFPVRPSIPHELHRFPSLLAPLQAIAFSFAMH